MSAASCFTAGRNSNAFLYRDQPMAKTTIEVSFKVVWWVRWYLMGVALTSRLTGLTPDFGKVEATILRGIKLVIR